MRGSDERKARRAASPRQTAVDPLQDYFNFTQESNGSCFTLREEARNTSRASASVWQRDPGLRHRPVLFVSAGTTGPLEHPRDVREDPGDRESTPLREQPQHSNSFRPPIIDERSVIKQTAPQASTVDQTQNRPIPRRAISPTPSNSSEEVILFKGRGNHPPSSRTAVFDVATIQAEIQAIEQEEVTQQRDPAVISKVQADEGESILPVNMPKRKTSNRKRRARRFGKKKDFISELSNTSPDGQAQITDYFDNLQRNDQLHLGQYKSFSFRDIGGSENEFGTSPSPPSCFPACYAGDEEEDPLSVDDTSPSGQPVVDHLGPASEKCSPKRSRGLLPRFEVSDSDLEERMQAAWSNNRLKKSERRKQRELLRTQVRLGESAGATNMIAKYPHGMNLDEAIEELRLFLCSTNEQVIFPAIAKHHRQALHQMANKLHMKSKSTGSGDNRRPVLYRTKATLRYDARIFDEVTGRVYWRFSRGQGKKPRVSTRGAGGAGTRYREGEVVGGNLPELGHENRGRAMLQKMGWSSGTALGAIDNKGILEPVSQVIKHSKTGLG